MEEQRKLTEDEKNRLKKFINKILDNYILTAIEYKEKVSNITEDDKFGKVMDEFQATIASKSLLIALEIAKDYLENGLEQEKDKTCNTRWN